MKILFGFLGVVLTLVILGSVVKKQLAAVDGGIAERTEGATRVAAPPASRDGAIRAVPGGLPGAVAADPHAGTVAEQSRAIQAQVRERTVQSLQQGMERNRAADR